MMVRHLLVSYRLRWACRCGSFWTAAYCPALWLGSRYRHPSCLPNFAGRLIPRRRWNGYRSRSTSRSLLFSREKWSACRCSRSLAPGIGGAEPKRWGCFFTAPGSRLGWLSIRIPAFGYIWHSDRSDCCRDAPKFIRALPRHLYTLRQWRLATSCDRLLLTGSEARSRCHASTTASIHETQTPSLDLPNMSGAG